MSKDAHQHRKDAHLSLALSYWKEKHAIEDDEVVHAENAAPVALFGHTFEFPFYIEAMTGGSARGDALNLQLAEIAKSLNLALAVGSQSIALHYPELEKGFRAVRAATPKGFLFANIGAGSEMSDARRAVDMIEANALEIHMNMYQELGMREDEGDRDFSEWLETIDRIAADLDVPVIAKEVGFGMPRALLEALQETHVAAINVGGRGGTDFGWIEHRRNPNGMDFTNFGLTTLESLENARLSAITKPLIATGGISSPADIARFLSAGASLTSAAGFVLSALTNTGLEKTIETLAHWKKNFV
ncbi:MAG: alpha-hydroxy-acid oxidizing protein [Streptococcaceae bacterium]|jgi:isopentenyl-diphosphate delta-isomerase|nr:alpha-hydroxy-acid oxidizing protein [Streptococcaceae bacterium]